MTAPQLLPPYPSLPPGDAGDHLHGTWVPDPFRRLEDPAAEGTREWSLRQDELFAAHRATWPALPRIAADVERLLAVGAVGAPTWRAGRCFVTRRDPAAQHPVLTVSEQAAAGGRPGEQWRVLVDPTALDPSGRTTLDGWSPDHDGDLVAVQLSRGGTEESELLVLSVADGSTVDGPISRTRYSPVAWLPRDAQGRQRFLYVRRLPPDQVPAGEEQFHRRVMLHIVGTPAADDVEVFGEGRPITSYFGVWVRRDGRWLVVSASDGTAPRTDVWLGDLGEAAAAVDPAAPGAGIGLREVAVGLDAQHSVRVGRDDRLYVHTDLDAPRGRLCVADPAAPGHGNWRTLLPEDPVAVLADAVLLDSPDAPAAVLAVTRTRHAVAEVSLHMAADGSPGPALTGLPANGTLGGWRTRPEGGHEAWAVWTDETTPARVLRLRLRGTAEVDVWEEPPGRAPDGPPLRSRMVAFTGADGTALRMIVTRRETDLGPDGTPRGPQPTVLYGYGGFGADMSPAYSASTLAWARAGGTWVTAQLRGGGEEGEQWHRDGMLGRKQNVFDDFHAAAQALVEQGWTTPGQLGLSGGSNGGLLVGAALTQHPDDAAAILCSAPLLDMVRYPRFGLGATWTSEYGDPADPEQLGWLLGYSPYHAVREQTPYPAVLFTVFDSDTRVDPLHARKMCAALQHATTSDPTERPVLLRREADVGHGARSLSRRVALAADGLAFLAHHTGLEWP